MDEARFNEMKVEAGLVANSIMSIGKKHLEDHFKVEAFRDGELLWVEEFDNLVVNVGLDDSLDKHLKGSSYTAAWYVGVVGSSPTFAAGDTMGGAHAGWTEQTTYDEATRPVLTLGTVSGQSVNNSASKAVFTISGTVTLGGAFIVTTNNKGGTTGILYGGGAFSQNRALVDNDVLNVTITCTAAAS
jgi:hypothetical protein